HVLVLAQAGESRLLLVVLGADLHERAIAPDAHDHRLAALGVGAQLARLRHFLARQLLLVLDLLRQVLPELRQQRLPLFLAAGDGMNAWPSMSTYSRFCRVEMIEA